MSIDNEIASNEEDLNNSRKDSTASFQKQLSTLSPEDWHETLTAGTGTNSSPTMKNFRDAQEVWNSNEQQVRNDKPQGDGAPPGQKDTKLQGAKEVGKESTKVQGTADAKKETIKPQDAPQSEKAKPSYFDKPYDQKEAAKLIADLDSTMSFKTRSEAKEGLASMGPKVIPQLQEALKETKAQGKDDNKESAIQNTINRINTQIAKERTEDWMNKSDKILDNFKSILKGADTDMRIQFREMARPVPNEAGLEAISSAQAMFISGRDNLTSPTKADQQKFDKMITDLDNIDTKSPEFQKTVNEAAEYAYQSGLPEGTKAKEDAVRDHHRLASLEAAKDAVRYYYAKGLSAGDAEDKAKGGKLLLEHMRNIPETMTDRTGQDIAELAIHLGIDKDPNFTKLWQAKQGTAAYLQEMREYVERKDQRKGK